MKRTKKSKKIEILEVVNAPESFQGVGGSGQNPLHNHVIVERLFDVMPFNLNDFKNFRAVSKVWWRESLQAFRKHVWLCINDSPEKLRSRHLSFETFVDWFTLPEDPYQLVNGKAHLHFTFSGKTTALQKQMAFWVQLGPKMTHLELSKSVMYNKGDLRRLIFELVPNLKHLSLQNCEFRDGPALLEDGRLGTPHTPWSEDYQPSPSQIQGNLMELEINFESTPTQGTDFPLCWVELFARYPNLQILTLKRHNRTDREYGVLGIWEEFVAFAAYLRAVRQNCGEHYFAQLQRFGLHGSVFGSQRIERQINDDGGGRARASIERLRRTLALVRYGFQRN